LTNNYYFFVKRPIFAFVIAIILLICGIIAINNIAIAQYPKISPPSIVVNANYPGASAITIDRNVASVLEAKLNGINHLLYMNANSTGSGSVSVRLTFEVGSDLNQAINEVLNRVHAVMPMLPAVVQKLGVNVKKSSPDFLMNIVFYNDKNSKYNKYYVSNYLKRTLYNDLSLAKGVGQISFYALPYAIRIWLDINKMNALHINPAQIINSIQEQNNQYIIGNTFSNYDSSLLVNIIAKDTYITPDEFAKIIIDSKNKQFIYLKDVAKIELGANSYNIIPTITFKDNNIVQNHDIALMQIYLEPSANQIKSKQDILDRLNIASKNFPNGLHYKVVYDATEFITASIKNVLYAFLHAFLLVGLVIFIFLKNWRSSLIAILAIPTSIIGSISFLYLFGFSINTLTLFALVLTIGIVVDDTIIVIENFERLKLTHPNMDIKQLVSIAIKEVFRPVITIGLVLSVVFIPVMFLGGLAGVMYQQFAITITTSVILSVLVSITLTPALLSIFENKQHVKLNFLTSIDKYINIFTNLAYKTTNFFIGKFYAFGVIIIVVIITIILFKLVPLSFVPNEDQGNFIVTINLPTSSSLQDSKQITESVSSILIKQSAVDSITKIIGVDFYGGGANSYASSLIVRLKNWEQRNNFQTVDNLVKYVNQLDNSYNNVKIRAFNRPPISGLSTTGGVEFYLEDRVGDDLINLDNMAIKLEAYLKKHREIKQAYHLLDSKSQQVLLSADIDKVKYYKTNLKDVLDLIHYVYSSYNINMSYIMQSLVWVILQADYKYRNNLDAIKNLYVKNSDNIAISLNNLITTKLYISPSIVERFNDYLATKIIVMPNSGVNIGEVMDIIKIEMATHAKKYNYEWVGTSYMLDISNKTSVYALIFAIIMIYLLLVALYEMWLLPLVVILMIPFAIFGAMLFLYIINIPNDLYFQISLITLLGLSTKNTILYLDFALNDYKITQDARLSALNAFKVRFRPILMTSITFIVGAIPLVLATGAGAMAEHSVAIGIIGGMVGSVLIANIVAPSIFYFIMWHKKDV
jgi:multidrug efflux pump